MKKSNIAVEIEKFLPRIAALYPRIPVIETSSTDPVVHVNNKDYMIFCSNNYLGLANADFVKEAAVQAIKTYGFGSGGSRWISGTTDLHVQLEEKMADFIGKEEAVTFSAGFMTNSGVLPALAGSFMGDYPFPADKAAVFSDELNHASIIDGCRNSKARVYVYKHKDVDHLASLLAGSKETYKLIVTDGVFSMDGDIAPLDKIVDLAKDHKAMVMVDDAHAVGIIGDRGRGTGEHFNIQDEIDISMGTLSKTFGALGGYVSCSHALAKYIRGAARTYVFSAAMPACGAAVIISIIDKISKDLSFTIRLRELSSYLRKRLGEMDLNTLDSETAIIPIFIGGEKRAIELSEELFKRGIYLSCVMWPAVPKNQARLRVTVTANHTREQIDEFLSILEHVVRRSR